MQLRHLPPNAATLGNMTFGFLAISAAAAGAFERAVIYLFLAVGCDTLDGRLARMLNATSKFGAELDSLSDAVSFGVAPAVLVYLATLHQLGGWGQAAAVSYLLCAAIRLARFNIDTGPMAKMTFQGVPTPAAAGYLMSFVMLRGQMSAVMVAVGVVSLAFFMVSTLKVPKLGRYGLPGWLLIGEAATFLAFLYRPTVLTWHIWNGWNWSLVGVNYIRLARMRPGKTGGSDGGAATADT